jgi:hypothetical protein
MANSNIVNFAINVTGNAAQNISAINQTVNSFTSRIQKIRDIGLAFQAVDAAVGKLVNALNSCKQAYLEDVVAETKLMQVMSNTIGATDMETQRILDLAAAQEKLGVISAGTQVAGAQELATYLTKTESIEKLIPAMNDMVAQQFGLNASQEQATQVASMLGKVMDGQTGALSRYGYSFDAAQEKILKTGTESQRAAVLFDVVNSAVGGVNEALAQTPAGAMKQAANAAGSLQSRIGKLYIELQAKLAPALHTVVGWLEKAVGWLERNSTIVAAVAIAVGTLVAAIKGWIIVQGIINTLLALNPLGLLIIGIIALIAVIVYLSMKIKGWGSLWEAVWGFAKNITLAYVETIKQAFNTMINGLMMGIDKIRIGWYKFKETLGLGNSGENKDMIRQINADVENRKQQIVDGAKKIKEYSKAAIDSWKKVNMSWDSEVTLKSTTDKLKKQLGINSNVENSEINKTSNSISGGGKSIRNFNITINDGLIKTVNNHFASTGETPDSASDFMWQMSKALQLMLNDVNYAAQ